MSQLPDGHFGIENQYQFSAFTRNDLKLVVNLYTGLVSARHRQGIFLTVFVNKVIRIGMSLSRFSGKYQTDFIILARVQILCGQQFRPAFSEFKEIVGFIQGRGYPPSIVIMLIMSLISMTFNLYLFHSQPYRLEVPGFAGQTQRQRQLSGIAPFFGTGQIGAVTILINFVAADFGCVRIHIRIGVVTIAGVLSVTVAVTVNIFRTGQISAVTVLVNLIAADFFGFRMNVRIGIITIAGIFRVTVPVIIGCQFAGADNIAAVTVLINTVAADFLGSRICRRFHIITVAVVLCQPVTVIIHIQGIGLIPEYGFPGSASGSAAFPVLIEPGSAGYGRAGKGSDHFEIRDSERKAVLKNLDRNISCHQRTHTDTGSRVILVREFRGNCRHDAVADAEGKGKILIRGSDPVSCTRFHKTDHIAAVTVLVNAVPADFNCTRIYSGIGVITIAVFNRIAVGICVRILIANHIAAVTILINTVAADIFGLGMECRIRVVTVAFSLRISVAVRIRIIDGSRQGNAEIYLRSDREYQLSRSFDSEHGQGIDSFLYRLTAFKVRHTEIKIDRQGHGSLAYRFGNADTVVRIVVIVQRHQELTDVGHFRMLFIGRAFHQIHRCHY